jgi:hypothetical protein
MDNGDDLDRLLSRSVPAPPAGLQARVVRRSAVAARAGRLTLALAGYLVSLGLLVVLAAHIGRAVTAGGARDLITLAVQDRSLVLDYPWEYTLAVVQALPWPSLAALAATLVALRVLIRYLLSATDEQAAPWRRRT